MLKFSLDAVFCVSAIQPYKQIGECDQQHECGKYCEQYQGPFQINYKWRGQYGHGQQDTSSDPYHRLCFLLFGFGSVTLPAFRPAAS